MTPSDLFKGAFSWVGSFANIASHANTALDIASVIRGNEPSKEAPAVVKGAYGVFGYADERKFTELLDELEKKRPGSRQKLSDFLKWMYRCDTFEERIFTFWYANAFRSFVTKMTNAERIKVGSKKSTREYTTAKTKEKVSITIDEELYRPTSNEAIDFLGYIVDIIDAAPAHDKVPAYTRLRDQFEILGVPHFPEGGADMLKTIEETARKFGKTTYDALNNELVSATRRLEERADRLESRRGPFNRFINWL